MSFAGATDQKRVLIVAEDRAESDALRSRLDALSARRYETTVCHPAVEPWPARASGCELCLLVLPAGTPPLLPVLAKLLAASPGLYVIGVLGKLSRSDDHNDIAQALRLGLRDVVVLEDLSQATLAAMLEPVESPAAASHRPTVEPAPTETRAEPGRWRIELLEQRASFDATTQTLLGYAPGQLGVRIGDWKALIHADDIDPLIEEIHRRMTGAAPGATLGFRIHSRNRGWIAAESTAITVHSDAQGAPAIVDGEFLLSGTGHAEAIAGAGQQEFSADPVLNHCQTGIVVYESAAAGREFRVRYCNDSAARLDGLRATALVAQRVAELTPKFDGFVLEEALERVNATGIAESHDVMSLLRCTPPQWRSIRLSRLPDHAVLAEVEDISARVQERQTQHAAEELAECIARSYPVTSLLVDDQGRVIRYLSDGGNALPSALISREYRAVKEILGEQSGAECLRQVSRTLNTGRNGIAIYDVDAPGGKYWLECHTAMLRGRPGLPQRVILTLVDVSDRIRERDGARSDADYLREGLRKLPLPCYLKDLDGRYQAVNPAFEALFGAEEAMVIGKSDYEIFPDEIATELHENDRRLIESAEAFAEMRVVGQARQRGLHYCFSFPVATRAGRTLGSGGIWIAPQSLAAIASPHDTGVVENEAPRALRRDDLGEATASVITRVEDALTSAGDYTNVLHQLEQLVETTMQAQALIHHVAGQVEPSATGPLTALAPLAQDIVELERILIPPTARLENDIAESLPPAHCDPVVFHQILLRGIRHARRTLSRTGRLAILLRRASNGKRPCISCQDGFEGSYIELIIEDSDSRLADSDINRLMAAPSGIAMVNDGLNDLAEIHGLAHTQGGHLQIQTNVPTGTSLHIFFRANDEAEFSEGFNRPRSTVARFPVGRAWQGKNPPQ